VTELFVSEIIKYDLMRDVEIVLKTVTGQSASSVSRRKLRCKEKELKRNDKCEKKIKKRSVGESVKSFNLRGNKSGRQRGFCETAQRLLAV